MCVRARAHEREERQRCLMKPICREREREGDAKQGKGNRGQKLVEGADIIPLHTLRNNVCVCV